MIGGVAVGCGLGVGLGAGTVRVPGVPPKFIVSCACCTSLESDLPPGYGMDGFGVNPPNPPGILGLRGGGVRAGIVYSAASACSSCGITNPAHTTFSRSVNSDGNSVAK